MSIRTLDISELNERLCELETLRDAVTTAQEASDEDKAEAQDRLNDATDAFGGEEEIELAKLNELEDKIGEYRGKIDDTKGPFAHENDLQGYAQELAEDIGAIDDSARWPHTYIDWEQAARDMAMDYISVEWEGVTYLYRSWA